MKYRLAFALLAVVLLAACGHTEPIVRYKYMMALPPEALVQDCSVTLPPSKDAYQQQNWTQREKALTDTSINQYRDLALCNNDKAALRSWRAAQKRLVEEQEAKP